MTTSTPTRLDQRLTWARQTLDLADDAQWPDIRARMLRLVTDEDFVPSEGAMQAFRTLESEATGVAELEDPPAFARQSEQDLEAAAAALAVDLFRLPPDERQARWSRLVARCERAPRARVWLERLVPGLKLEVGELHTRPELLGQLGKKVCELFVTRNSERARLRAEFVASAQEKRTQWEIAARQLQKQYPALAALEPQVVTMLLAPVQPSSGAPRLDAVQRQPSSSGGTDLRWVWILVIVLVGIMARIPSLISNPSGTRSTYPSSSAPAISPEQRDRIDEILRRNKAILEPRPGMDPGSQPSDAYRSLYEPRPGPDSIELRPLLQPLREPPTLAPPTFELPPLPPSAAPPGFGPGIP